MRMRQLMHGDGGSSGPIVVESIVHIPRCIPRNRSCLRDKSSLPTTSFRSRAHTSQDIAHVFDHSLASAPGYRDASVPESPLPRPAIVLSPGASLFPKQKKIAGALHVRIFAARLRLALDHFAFDFPHCAFHRSSRPFTAECRYCSTPSRNSVNACRLHVRSRRVPRRQMGVRRSRKNQQFTHVMPTFICCATRWPRFKFVVQIEAARPYFVSFAMLMASSSVSKGATWHTGPKISSFTQRADSGNPV